MSHRPTAADATSTVTSAASRDSVATSGATASSSSPVSVAASAAGAATTEDCPSPTGARPESYSGSNNSPFAARTDPEPTHCEIARENNHKWTRLVGYSVDEATRRAKAAGWERKIEVRQLTEYDAKCKEGLVCSFQPARWEIGDGSTLTLYTNHKVAISTPD